MPPLLGTAHVVATVVGDERRLAIIETREHGGAGLIVNQWPNSADNGDPKRPSLGPLVLNAAYRTNNGGIP
jgi:hypothetical protein